MLRRVEVHKQELEFRVRGGGGLAPPLAQEPWTPVPESCLKCRDELAGLLGGISGWPIGDRQGGDEGWGVAGGGSGRRAEGGGRGGDE